MADSRNKGIRKAREYEFRDDDNFHEVARQLALNLGHFRKSKWLTQTEMSREIGIPQSVISHLESGFANPPLLTIVRLARFFNVSPEDLLKRD